MTLHPQSVLKPFTGFKLNLLLQSDQFLTILHPFVVIFSLFVVPLALAYLFSDVTSFESQFSSVWDHFASLLSSCGHLVPLWGSCAK